MIRILSTLTLSALFTAAPTEVLPLIDKPSRLDMVDLYEAGMSAVVANRFGGQSELTMLSDTLVALRLTEISTVEMRLLADSTIELRHTYALPEGVQTTKKYYNTNWTPKE